MLSYRALLVVALIDPLLSQQTVTPEPLSTTRPTPIPHSFCHWAVTADKALVVEDTRRDLLLSANRATIGMGIVAYAGQLATIVVVTIVASSAGAGIPGSSLVTTLIVLNAIGLGPNASAGIALIAGIDRPLDMCRTAVNTFSNLVGTAVVARAEGER